MENTILANSNTHASEAEIHKKMEIKKAVVELNGVYPPYGTGLVVGEACLLRQIAFSPEFPDDEIGSLHSGGSGCDYSIYKVLCTRSEFESTAKIMGF